MRRSPFAWLFNLISILFFLMSIGVVVFVVLRLTGRA